MSDTKRVRDKKFYAPTPMQVTGFIFAALFAAMSVYLCRYAYTNRQTMMSNSYNSRQKILADQNVRGDIVSVDGLVLATTVADEGGDERREYPEANTFAHVIGYDTKGKSGIEAKANYWLIRSDISLSEKARLSDEGAKNPGDIVTVTIDSRLQEAAYRALSAYMGAIVATDVRTGAVLAMVSKPDFDPNEIDAIWDRLISDKDDTRLLNRASQGLYPPGSTLKIVTALQYIREHSDSFMDYGFNCRGSFSYGGETIHCFHGESHGAVDFYTSFQKSCNSSFANIGVGLDRAAYAETVKELYFNEALELDVPYSASRASIDASSGDGDVMQLAIGQGATAVSPLHLNMITQAAASGGVMLKPFVIESVDSADGRNLESRPGAGELKRVMSEGEAAILREMMELVVDGGTGRRLSGLDYTAAGKTGSAEYNSNKKEESHAWFTGYAPADEPEIAVTVIIEEAGSGGEYAVPMAKRVFDEYFTIFPR